MNKKTLKALNESIAKWERNAKAETPANYLTTPADCPLCELFFGYPKYCEGCPVAECTGEAVCDGSPYDDAAKAGKNWTDHPQSNAYRYAARAAARKEVRFLRSLLPEHS